MPKDVMPSDEEIAKSDSEELGGGRKGDLLIGSVSKMDREEETQVTSNTVEASSPNSLASISAEGKKTMKW